MEIKFVDGVSITVRKDLMLNVTLCVIWASMLLMYVKGILNRFPVIGEYSAEVLIAGGVLSVILSIPAILNKFCLIDYLFYGLNVFYLLSCYVFFPENAAYLDEEALTCIFCVFTYYFVGRLVNIDDFFNIFLFLSAVCIVMDLLYFLLYAQANKNMEEVAGEDNMYVAYRLLPHVALLLWSTLEKFRLWKAAVFFVGVLFLLSCGTRGPLVCLAFLGLVYFFFFMKFKGAIYVKMGIVSLSLLLLINLEGILLSLASTFTNLKLSTRILEKMITGELGNDSNRSVLRNELEHVMSEGEHFWGLGAFGCRNYDIIYPHFLPLDFACTYGYVLGYALLMLLFVLIGYSLWLSKGTKAQIFIVLLISISIVKLFISNSFLLEPYFYMLIGVCVKVVLDWHSGVHEDKHNHSIVQSSDAL